MGKESKYNLPFHHQVSTWINEKLMVASDESYRDPTNLQSKLQKHQAFEAELSANKERVDTICKVKALSSARILESEYEAMVLPHPL